MFTTLIVRRRQADSRPRWPTMDPSILELDVKPVEPGPFDAVGQFVASCICSPMFWLCSLAIVFLLHAYYPFVRWRYRRIPGPSPAPLVGNLSEIASRPAGLYEVGGCLCGGRVTCAMRGKWGCTSGKLTPLCCRGVMQSMPGLMRRPSGSSIIDLARLVV